MSSLSRSVKMYQLFLQSTFVSRTVAPLFS